MRELKNKANEGFITILILIVLSALTLAIILSFFEIGYQASRSGLEAEQGLRARAYADSCGENSLYYFSQGIDPATIEELFSEYKFNDDGNRCVIEDIEVLEEDENTFYYLIKSRGEVQSGQVVRRIEVYLKTTDAGESYSYKWTEVEEFNDLADYSL